MEFKLLGSSPEEIDAFKAAYWEAFQLVPDLDNMRPMVAYESDKIIGFFGLYQVIVADSMWVSRKYRRTGLWRKLIEAINALPWDKNRGYYFIEEKKKQGIVARMMGGNKLPVSLWRKVF